ncbi:type VI secretion system accessory protein TagJ [Methylomarinum vadi]|uniref:type VI secretion system accessory protein TagJ n=1 Tax=Methylomarinum vadi TaxID=438855 RepID=UPI0004DF7C08|nr:type VI secretion system accessory protein TagJ [Methylomarinum vadi]
MTAEESLKQGDIDTALLALQEQVRKQPANVELRVFLFQLLAVMGQWDRALTQLNVAGDMDDSTLAMVTMYRQVITCERLREQVFMGNKEPVVFGKPKEWVALLLQALKLTAQGEYAKSQQLRTQAFDEAEVTSGIIDEKSFAWIADSDPRLGPVMEAIIDGRYLWVPFENLKSIVVDEPVDLRDVIWLPAHFTWQNGGENYGLIPARYPFSYQYESLLALSRKTEWQDCGEDLFLGIGQKIWVTDVDEYPLMDVRSIQFNAGLDNDQES